MENANVMLDGLDPTVTRECATPHVFTECATMVCASVTLDGLVPHVTKRFATQLVYMANV